MLVFAIKYLQPAAFTDCKALKTASCTNQRNAAWQ